MRRVLLIYNPRAARVRPRRVAAVTREMERLGCEVRAVCPDEPEDTMQLAREAAGAVDVVAVYGGDGTTGLAVEGLIGTDVPVGLIPGGTGNLLAGNLGIPRNPVRAATVIATGTPRAIDLGRLESTDGARYFAVASGAGFDAQLMAGTVGSAKRRWGMAAYVAHAVRSLGHVRNVSCEIDIDGTLTPVDAATVLVANCRTIIPPVLHLGPGIELDDGQLDIVVLRADNWREVFGVVWHLLRRGPDNGRVRRFRGRRVAVRTADVLPVQFDGEAHGSTPFTAEVVPRGLRVMVAV